jgi:uncharacterized protein YoxC
MATKKVGKSSEPSVNRGCDYLLIKFLEDNFKALGEGLRSVLTDTELILRKEDKIMSDVADADAILVSIAPVIIKIGGETDGLLAKITALMANVGGNTPETQALLAHAQAIKDSLKTLDDKVPDAPPAADPGP